MISPAKKERDDKLKMRRKKHEATVKAATKANVQQKLLGQVKVGKLPHWRATSDEDKCWPQTDGFKNVNVHSTGRGVFVQLFPAKLGPINVKSLVGASVRVHNIENLWQFSKVYESDIDHDTEEPSADWVARRDKGWADPQGYLSVMKKEDVIGGKGDDDDTPVIKPRFFMWGNTQLSFLKARRSIFCRAYASLVVKTEGYRKLVAMIQKGINIQILSDTGYDYAGQGRTLYQCLNDPNQVFGHEFVLAGLLTGNEPWQQNAAPETAPTGIPVPPSDKVLRPFLPVAATTTVVSQDDAVEKIAQDANTNGTAEEAAVPAVASTNSEPAPTKPRSHKRKTTAPRPSRRKKPATEQQKVEEEEVLDAGSVASPSPPAAKRAKLAPVSRAYILVHKDEASTIPRNIRLFLDKDEAFHSLEKDDCFGSFCLVTCEYSNGNDDGAAAMEISQ